MTSSAFLWTAATLVAGASLIGSAVAQDSTYRAHHEGLPVSQTADQVDARTARMRAELHLTSEQETRWSGFESAMRDYFKNQKEREIAMRADRAQQKTPVDVIERMRSGAKFTSQGAANEKALADAAQPLFTSLNDQQKQQFTEMLMFGNESDLN